MTELLGISLVLVLAVGCLTYAVMAKRVADRRVRSIQAQNDKLRETIGSIVGWETDGRLHDDWGERLRVRVDAEYLEARPNREAAVVKPSIQMLKLARELLSACPISELVVAMPSVAGLTSVEAMHSRLIQTVSNVIPNPTALPAALQDGDFDSFYSLASRLEVYFQAAPVCSLYRTASALVTSALALEGINVLVLRPTSIVREREAQMLAEDSQRLKDNLVIRSTISRFAARVAHSLRDDEGIVVDCIAPGWRSDVDEKPPRALVWDRSWGA